jgi:hypothetical protein
MSKPSFYNDNEYRSYPFVDQPTVFEALPENTRLPNDAVVDAGFIMNLDAQYEDENNIVYLASVSAADGTLRLRFANTAPACVGKLITFRRDYVTGANGIIAAEPEWTTEHAESESAANYCPIEPTWTGFLVTGKIEPLVVAALAAGGTLAFAAGSYTVEPARVQNLNKAYLRSVRVGNYSRITSPPCDATATVAEQELILDPACLTGDIKFKEGYNAKITQINNVNTLTFAAVKGGGAKEDSDLCGNYGEIPFYAEELANKPYIYVGDEQVPGRRSKFLSGGWSCKDLIFTINGLGGSNVNIVGGKNIQVGYDGEAGAITVKLSDTAQGRCNG